MMQTGIKMPLSSKRIKTRIQAGKCSPNLIEVYKPAKVPRAQARGTVRQRSNDFQAARFITIKKEILC